ncbi:MAG: TonB-dependent receptor [Geobacter sp.]|nr:MAG: TonB-dependent receptor [Geobacter sp.]
MAKNQHPEWLTPILPQKSQADRVRLRRFSALSALLHTVVLFICLIWTGDRLMQQPARVITVDLGHVEPSRPRLAPAPTPLPKPAPVPLLPRPAVKRPAPAVLPATARPQASLPAQPSATVTPTANATQTVPSAVAPQGVPSVMPARPATGAAPAKSGPAVAAPLPAPTVSGATGGTGRTANSADIRARYLQRCRGLIERYKEYPVMARKGMIEGTVVIRGSLGRDGSLRQCGVTRTSGSHLLDNAALRAVKTVERFPPVPPELLGNELIFELPITFKLSDG